MAISDRVQAVIDSALARQTIVGTVVLVSRHGEQVCARAAGFADRESQKPIVLNQIFRLASVTKPMVAATALAMIERGELSLDDSVSEHLPYFTPKTADGQAAPIAIRHLLTHTAGLGYDYDADPSICTGLEDTEFDFEANFSRVARLPLSFAPGTGWQYSVAIDVLGAVIAKVTGGTLEAAVTKFVTGPLGMVDTGFHVTDIDRLAVPYGDAKPEPLRMGDPHTVTEPDGSKTTFSPSRIFSQTAFQSGGAGAVGTAPDFMKFLEALRTGGGPILKPETVEMAVRNQIGDLPRREGDEGQRFGFLSAIVVDPKEANSPAAAGTFRWGGIYGHDWFVDPANGLSVAIFSNTAVEGCVGQYPKDIRDAVYG